MFTRMMTAASAVAALVMTSGAAWAQTAPAQADMAAPRDWSAALIADAQALHDMVIDSHPGVHDPLNPKFRARVDDGLRVALDRAATTRDVAGWWWALRAYVASFEDGHLQLELKDRTFAFPSRWPGHLTVYRGEAQVVAARDDADSAAPPIGARLVSCDGLEAADLAARRTGRFRGRWSLESQRAIFGDLLFVDVGNPWTETPRRCVFQDDAGEHVLDLNWRPIEAADLAARRRPLAQRAQPEFGVRRFDGGVWLSMPSFDGDPQGQAHPQLTAILERLKAEPDLARDAETVVLDLRANGGGSSHWSEGVAEALWGEAWTKAKAPPEMEAVEWRVSDANLATIQGYADEWRAAGEDAERIAWADEIVAGMTAARATGRPYWRDASEPDPRPDAGPNPVKGRVYVLTDSGCASACLDAVDLWKALGAVQIGRETSADTVYMDIRGADLPSGLAEVSLPMKVWRGRARGNNEPQRPTDLFEGDMTDEAALGAWVRTLG